MFRFLRNTECIHSCREFFQSQSYKKVYSISVHQFTVETYNERGLLDSSRWNVQQGILKPFFVYNIVLTTLYLPGFFRLLYTQCIGYRYTMQWSWFSIRRLNQNLVSTKAQRQKIFQLFQLEFGNKVAGKSMPGTSVLRTFNSD